MLFNKFKVVFIGLDAAGKTDLIAKLVDPLALLSASHIPTESAELTHLTLKTKDDQDIKFALLDASNSEGYKSNLLSYSQLIVLCVDFSSPMNQPAIEQCLVQARKTKGNKHTPILLVGTKSDVTPVVSADQIKNLLELHHFAKVLTVSSKEIKGLDELWAELVSHAKTRLAKSEIEHALATLRPESSLYEKISLFKEGLKSLPIEKQQIIGTIIYNFVTDLKSTENIQERKDVIMAFETEAIGYIGNSYTKITDLVLGVVVTALATIVAVAIGFGIGFAAGVWSGPGAFISGVLTGSMAACSVVAVSATLSAGLGFFAGVKCNNALMKPNIPIVDIANASTSLRLVIPTVEGSLDLAQC